MGQTAKIRRSMALVVHPDIAALTAFQGAFTQNGIQTIVARDLPTALLAMAQHYFDLAIISSCIAEEGDGWPLAAVVQMSFPRSLVGVIAPSTGVLELKSAINHQVSGVYERSSAPEEVVASLLGSTASQTQIH